MNKSKRKLLISMLVAMFVLLSAVAIVAIAFALTQQTITTTLNIGYTVTDLDGSVYATYTVGGITTHLNPNPVGGTVNGHSLVFSASDTQDAGTLDFPSNIDLSSTNDNIVIQYTYANTGGKHYIASMSFASNIVTDNMTVQYSKDGENYSTDRYAVVVPSGATEKSYWIKISITNKAKSASFSGDFQWVLKGYDEEVVGTDLYKSLTALEFSGSNGSYSASVTSAGSGQDGNIVFPSAVNGDPVTTISASETITDEEKLKIKSVVIPESVTEIGENAFRDYKNLQTVTFEQNKTTTSSVKTQSSTGLQTIGKNAFRGCTNLTTLTMPNSITSIGNDAFGNCTGLTITTLPSSLTSIGSWAFSQCRNLTITTIPSGVTSIKQGTFSYCTNLTTLTISSSVESIGSSAFLGCTGLTNIEIPSTVTSIGSSSVFKNCTNLQTVAIMGQVTSIYGDDFCGCSNLTSFMLNGAKTCEVWTVEGPWSLHVLSLTETELASATTICEKLKEYFVDSSTTYPYAGYEIRVTY